MTPENAAALGRAVAENAHVKGATIPEDVAMTASDLAGRYARELGNDPQDCAVAGAEAGLAARDRMERYREIALELEAEREAE